MRNHCAELSELFSKVVDYRFGTSDNIFCVVELTRVQQLPGIGKLFIGESYSSSSSGGGGSSSRKWEPTYVQQLCGGR